MSYDPFPSHPHRPPPPPHQPPPPPFGHAAPTPHRAPRRPPLGHHSDLRVLRTAYRWQRRTATLTALG